MKAFFLGFKSAIVSLYNLSIFKLFLIAIVIFSIAGYVIATH